MSRIQEKEQRLRFSSSSITKMKNSLQEISNASQNLQSKNVSPFLLTNFQSQLLDAFCMQFSSVPHKLQEYDPQQKQKLVVPPIPKLTTKKKASAKKQNIEEDINQYIQPALTKNTSLGLTCKEVQKENKKPQKFSKLRKKLNKSLKDFFLQEESEGDDSSFFDQNGVMRYLNN